MRRLKLIALLLLGGSLGACASGGDPAPLPVADIAPRAGDPEIAQVREVRPDPVSADDVICRREVPTGSHLPVRVCRTRAELEAERIESQRMLRERARGVPSPRPERGASSAQF